MRVLTLLMAAFVSHAAFATTAIRVFVRNADCAVGTIRAEPQCDGCADPRTARWSSRDGVADVQLDLSAAPEWRVQAHADGCWSGAAVVAASAEAATLAVWPSARFVASLVAPRGERAPDAVQLRVRSVREGEIPDALVDCTREKEQWACDVPAAELDVRVGLAGFVPHYFWGVRPERGRSFDAGSVALRRGSSITGRAMVAARGEEGPITVTLAPDAVSDSPRANLKTFTTTTNNRGFFQFAGFEPGAWTVTAMKNGWSPAQTNVVITEASETALPSALVLQPLTRVELTFDPPQDLGGADWLVKLDRAPAWGVRVPVSESASSEGRWQSDPVENGLYFITVTAADGSVVHQGGQMIAPGMPPLPIRIDRVVVRGIVTLGGEPVEARLIFRGATGKRVRMQSDAEGKFNGAISRDTGELWSVEVKPSETAFTATVRNVEIRAVDGIADVAIDLPNGKIFGKTVDESGQPVRALVRVYQDEDSAETKSAADGTFEIAGLPKGDVRLRARNAIGDTGFVTHTVHGSDDEPLTLVVPRKLKANVTIETPGGHPYAGAMVRVITAGGVMTDEVSGPNGRVPIASPAQAPLAYVIVVARGYSVAMRAVPLTGGDDSRRVVLPTASGQVFVPSRKNDRVRIGRVGMPLMSLYAWLDPPPDIFRNSVPGGHLLDLEPGEYRFCADRAEQVCVNRVVMAGSRQRIEFPKEQS